VTVLSFLLQTLAAATPLLLAALGEVFAERAGVLNIGLEGLLLAGALAAFVIAVVTGSAGLGLLAALVAGLAGAALFALFGVVLRRDQVIVGTTINFLALGTTGVLYRAWLLGRDTSVEAPPAPTLPDAFTVGGTASLPWLTLLALALVPLAHRLLWRTRLGVTLRAAGEVPAAAAAAGANVTRLRVLAVLAGGALCGAGGAVLSLGLSNTFTENMSGGRGFVALAIVVFGRWSVGGALLASLVFAAADVAQARLQAAGVFAVPYPVFLAIPYLLTLAALALRGARGQRAPAALGEPFEQA
jgi:simple sugar transport system permease protein